jgi:hypothetical protein
MSPPKVNISTTKDLSNSEMDEILNSEVKRTMIRMVNKLKGTCIST